MVKVADSGVQIEEFLRSFPLSESLLLSLLTPCTSVRLLDEIVAAGRRDHLLMVNIDQTRNFPDCSPVTLELVSMNHPWDVVFPNQPGQERLCSLGVPVPLKKDIEHETVLVHGPPQPMPDAIDARTHLILSANSLIGADYAYVSKNPAPGANP